MNTSASPVQLDYRSDCPFLRRLCRVGLRVCMLLAISVVGHFGWSCPRSALAQQATDQDMTAQMAELDRVVHRFADAPQSRTPASFAALSSQLGALLKSAPKAMPKSSIHVAGRTIIQAGEIRDPAGKLWTVIVCGGAQQASTLNWPSGSTDPQAIVCSFAYSIGHYLPESRIAMPAVQPPPSEGGKVLPVDYLIDGILQHASLSVDAKGQSLGHVDGWQDADTMGNPMVWGEVGRYGYRNVDVSLPPARLIDHPDGIGAMSFLPDNSLVMASRGRFEVINLDDSSAKTIERPQDKQRFFRRYVFSQDGKRFIIPRAGRQQPAVVDVLTGEEHALPVLPSDLIDSYVCPAGPDTVLLANHDWLAEVTLSTSTLKTQDIVVQEDGSMNIVGNDAGRARSRTTRAVCLTFAAGKMALSHLAGVYVFARQGDRWGASVRIKDWDDNGSLFVSLSPDGKWLASSSRIYDVAANRVLFEADGRQAVPPSEQASWSRDGALVAISPATLPILCATTGQKLAVRVLDPAGNLGKGKGILVCLSQDGKYLAAMSNHTRKLLVWNVADLLAAANAHEGTRNH